MPDAMIERPATLTGRTRPQPPARWSAQLRDALTRRQKELPMALVDAAMAAVTPGAPNAPQQATDGAFMAAVTRELLPQASIRTIFFVDGIPEDARMVSALPPDEPRTIVVAHRTAATARSLAEHMAAWRLAPAVHGFMANAAEDLLCPVMTPRPALVVLPGNVLGARTTVDMVRVLRSLRTFLRPGDRALVSLDLRDDADALVAAFSAPGGAWDVAHRLLTEEIARVLGSAFDPDNLRFEARYDRASSRVEGHVVARKAMLLTLGDGTLVPIGRRESLRTIVSGTFERKRFEGTLRGCALEARAWIEDASTESAIALIEPAAHT